jgi:hypothetical protein
MFNENESDNAGDLTDEPFTADLLTHRVIDMTVIDRDNIVRTRFPWDNQSRNNLVMNCLLSIGDFIRTDIFKRIFT